MKVIKNGYHQITGETKLQLDKWMEPTSNPGYCQASWLPSQTNGKALLFLTVPTKLTEPKSYELFPI